MFCCFIRKSSQLLALKFMKGFFFNGITLGQRQTDQDNQLNIISERTSFYIRYQLCYPALPSSLSLSVCLFVSLYLCLSVSISVYISLSLSFSLYLLRGLRTFIIQKTDERVQVWDLSTWIILIQLSVIPLSRAYCNNNFQ